MKHCDVGTYEHTKTLTIPDRLKNEYTKLQFCDSCIYEEVQWLLDRGVITIASCCGHGKMKPSIVTDKKSFFEMVGLGYKLVRQIGKDSAEWELKTRIDK